VKSACLTVDLDSLGHYCRIHGLLETDLRPAGVAAAHAVAIPRLLELFDRLRAPATFFAIGKDLAETDCAMPVKQAAQAGHEIGNHTWSHDYALVRRPAASIADDVAKGSAAIAAAVGTAPKGFRAPGYTLSAELYGAVVEQGYTYDSSVYPAVPYYLAKAAILGVMRLASRDSAAILDRPAVLAAPRLPYRPSLQDPYKRGNASTWELPISTAPVTRIPFIGTTLVMLPRPLVAAVYRSLRGSSFLNLELHSIDVLDESDGAGPLLAAKQRDLKIPASVKMARLAEVFRWIADDFQLTTLRDAAAGLESKTDSNSAE
jgi:hypothetical protein